MSRRTRKGGRGADAGGQRAAATQITLSEEAGIRYLHFGSPWVQGAMRISKPDELVLDYVQQMMAWLLFLPAPQRILQLGLGAGSLTRFCLRHCPASAVTVVELSPEVIDAAHAWFALPADHARLDVVCADAQDFVSRPGERGRYGVIQVDLYDMQARGPAIESNAFYRACVDALAPPGVCVVNLFGRDSSYDRNLARISRVFEGRVIELPPGRAGNRVVLGFKGPPLAFDWRMMEWRGSEVRRLCGLPAHEWVMALRRRMRGPVCAV